VTALLFGNFSVDEGSFKRAVMPERDKREQYHGEASMVGGGIDRFIAEVMLPSKTHGRFFEMGAFDGVSSSQSYFVEYHRSWTGVMVEANTANFKLARRNRPRTTLHNVAISKQEGFLTNTDGFGPATRTTCRPSQASAQDLRAYELASKAAA
jgi:hypothetical protein